MREMNYLKGVLGVSLLLLGFSFVACDDTATEETEANNEVSEDVTARVMASSVSYDSYGVTAILNYLTEESKEIVDEIECGKEGSNEDKITYTTSNGKITTSYEYFQTYSKTCSPELMLNYATTAKHITTGGYFSTDNDIFLDVHLKGIDDAIDNLYVGGSYQMNGKWEELATKTKLNVDVKMTLTDLTIQKDIKKVVAGVIDFTVKIGLANSFLSISQEGQITILNEAEARIDFDNGGSYLVNLKTGEVKEIA